MCKPYNGKMKQFKWRPGIFQRRLNQLEMIVEVCGIVRDERFYRTIKRLGLFADLESLNIQPPCHWNYSLAPDEFKVGLMNRECPCGINTDEVHYMDMNELEFNEKGEIIFTTDHDTDFGFGYFYGIEMWTSCEENKIHQLVEKMDKSNENQQQSIKAEIIKFIDDTMTAYEDEVQAYEFCKIIEIGIEAQLSVIMKDSIPRQNIRQNYHEQQSAAPKISKPKKVLTSRQKRLQADAIQAAKDVEEAKMKQLEKNKNESADANGKKKKKKAKTHFRKSQKPARL